MVMEDFSRQGNGLRLFIFIGCIPFLAEILLYFLPNSQSLIINLLYSATGLVIGAFEICLLSLSFNFLSKISVESGNTNCELLAAQ